MRADLLLHKELYQRECVDQAVQDYRALARIKVSSLDKYIGCTFSRCSYSKETTIKEFSNYVIDLMNQVTLG